MILADFDYIALPPRTDDLRADAANLLLANGKPRTLSHVEAVAGECLHLARRFQLCEERCEAAGLLHDIAAVIRPSDMLAYAQANRMPLCQAEITHPFLLHQRISALIAREYFGVADEAVLSPIRCHTTLKKCATSEDMALFIADKIAWDQPGEPPYLHAVTQALTDGGLEKACLSYMQWSVSSGRLLCPHDDWTEAMAWLQSLLS